MHSTLPDLRRLGNTASALSQLRWGVYPTPKIGECGGVLDPQKHGTHTLTTDDQRDVGPHGRARAQEVI